MKTGDADQVAGVGVGDEVWFNSGDGNYYTASSMSPLRPLDLSGAADSSGAAILGVIDSKDEGVLQLVPMIWRQLLAQARIPPALHIRSPPIRRTTASLYRWELTMCFPSVRPDV